MAVKDFNEIKNQQIKQKKKETSIVSISILAGCIVLLCITVFAFVIPNHIAAEKYNEEAAKIESQITQMQQESDEIKKSLENKDELYEKIAREKYGYCKPGEKVFYNSSFGE